MPAHAARKALNPRMIAALPPAPVGKKRDVMDSLVPNFGVCVSDRGNKSFVLIKRMPGARNAARHTLAKVGAIDLAAAREMARRWLEAIANGVDPRASDSAAERERRNAFDAVLEDYIERRLTGKKRDEIARALRREFGKPWKGRPIREITTEDVATIVLGKARSAPTQARNVLSHLGRFFRWAVACGKVPFSPAAQIRPSDLLGKVTPRSRVLTDDELGRVWRAAKETAYPWGPIYLLLILTGVRLNEVADAQWSEIDMRGKVWTIPGSRMKGKLDHVIPLPPATVQLLQSLPRWNQGDYVFSNTGGVKPVTVSDFVKGRMDVKARVYDWRNHDIRRTVRTHLSAIPTIPEVVRELMVAHKRKGIERVYDLHSYPGEKREGFLAWQQRLATLIVKPEQAMASAA